MEKLEVGQAKTVTAIVEYSIAWNKVRAATSQLLKRRCEYMERGDEYSSGTPPCFHDKRTLKEDGEPDLGQWCETCIEGRKLIEERKALTKTMRLKLDVVRRLGMKLTRTRAKLEGRDE